jgi:hypothetical protein
MEIITGKFNGNEKWDVSFTVPGETLYTFAENEVPLLSAEFIYSPPTGDMAWLWAVCLASMIVCGAVYSRAKKSKKG